MRFERAYFEMDRPSIAPRTRVASGEPSYASPNLAKNKRVNWNQRVVFRPKGALSRFGVAVPVPCDSRLLSCLLPPPPHGDGKTKGISRRAQSGAEARPLYTPVQYFDTEADADIIALTQRRLRPAPGRGPLTLERKNQHLQRTIHLPSCATPAHAPVFIQFTVRAPAAWKRVQRTVTRHPSRIRRVS
ncbi:hypothetical protein K438DRAFT_1775455 [Mycena galopus ATCC 62051]|nr:hypothetical protein K438DRAFT_1775455 [Mycena galopus ATCC 62051]